MFSCSYFLLGGTTYRGRNYSLPFSWSCQSSIQDNRYLPVCSDPLAALPPQTLGKAGVGKFQEMWKIKGLEGTGGGDVLAVPQSLTFHMSQPPGRLVQVGCLFCQFPSIESVNSVTFNSIGSTLQFAFQALKNYGSQSSDQGLGTRVTFTSVPLITGVVASFPGVRDFPVDSLLGELLGHVSVVTSCLSLIYFFLQIPEHSEAK